MEKAISINVTPTVNEDGSISHSLRFLNLKKNETEIDWKSPINTEVSYDCKNGNGKEILDSLLTKLAELNLI